MVLALDDREGCLRAAEMVRRHYPHVRVVARGFDMIHAYKLMDLGVDDFERETFNAALSLGERVLVSLGVHPYAANPSAKVFHRYDNQVVHDLHRVYKQRSEWAVGARTAREQLRKIFAEDEKNAEQGQADSAWVVR